MASWLYNRNLDRDVLKLQKNCYVDRWGAVWYSDKELDEKIGQVELLPPQKVIIPLEWDVSHEQKQVTVTCQKLTGKHEFQHSSRRIKESADGMRGPSNMVGDRTKTIFVTDEYSVTVSMTVTKAINQFGETVTGEPKIPEISSLSYRTGYGKQNEYTIGEIVELDLPAEKTEEVRVDQREHLYKNASVIAEAWLLNNPPAKAKKEVKKAEAKPQYDCGFKVGDKLLLPRLGEGVVKKIYLYDGNAILDVKFKSKRANVDLSVDKPTKI